MVKRSSRYLKRGIRYGRDFRKGNYVILTASKGAPYNDIRRNKKLMRRLARVGVKRRDIVPVQGIYQGQKEQSYYIRKMNPNIAKSIGQRYNQDSIMVGRSMVYSPRNARNRKLRGGVRPNTSYYGGMLTGRKSRSQDFHTHSQRKTRGKRRIPRDFTNIVPSDFLS